MVVKKVEIIEAPINGFSIVRTYTGDEAQSIVDALNQPGGLVVCRGGFEAYRFTLDDLKHNFQLRKD